MSKKSIIAFIIIFIIICVVGIILLINNHVGYREVNINQENNEIVQNINTENKMDSKHNNTLVDNINSNIKNENLIVNEDEKSTIDVEKVTLNVKKNTVSSYGATVVITDTNEPSLCWGQQYRIQEKKNAKWEFIKTNTDNIIFESMAYILDENHQYSQKIDWSKHYGKLSKGTYRIVKDVYNNGYMSFYSNEFTID